MGPVALVVGAVASVVGTIGSLNAQRKAAAAQERQERLARRRSQRQAIREYQIRRAQLLATGEGLGATGSSALAGGAGALSSQLGAELGYSSAQSALSGIISKNLQRANFFGGLTSLGGSLMNVAYSEGASFKGLYQRQPEAAPTPATSAAYAGTVRPRPAPRRRTTGSGSNVAPYYNYDTSGPF